MSKRANGVLLVKSWEVPFDLRTPPDKLDWEPDARILTMPNIYRALHGCLEGEAEVLTPDGWKRIDSVTTKDTVMCWSNGLLFFDAVQDTIVQHTEYAYKIGYKKERNFDMLYSPGHRIPIEKTKYTWGAKGRYKYDTPKKSLRVVTAEDYTPKTSEAFYMAGKGTGENIELTIDERILIAIQADGYLLHKNRVHNNKYVYRISLKKPRKISRLRELLSKSSFEWTESPNGGGYTAFKIWVDRESKTFSNVFEWGMEYKKARSFIEELWEWDGYCGERQKNYTSTRYDNICFVQAVAAQANFTTNTCKDPRSGKTTQDGKKHSDCWTIWFMKKPRRGTQNTKKEKIEYGKDMYCITVESSFFLVKYHDIVMITGNSGCQPRTILGAATWNHMRKKCYFDAGYRCEACGEEPPRGYLDAHELFDTNWEEGYARFVRCVALCRDCHQAIHSGRNLTLYKQGNPLVTKEVILRRAEKLFSGLSEWNKKHPKEKPLRAYDTWLNALKIPELAKEMQALIDKYGITFYAEDEKKVAPWKKWRVIIGDKEYPTPYKSAKDWVAAMDDLSRRDDKTKAVDPFTGGAYDEIKELLKSIDLS